MRQGRNTALEALLATGVVAVVRVDQPTGLLPLAEALHAGGVVLTEITMTVPGALEAIEATVREHGEEVFVGAGTVRDAATARLAISAGASFIVSPCLNLEVVSMAHRYGVMVAPGCLSPTEIDQACAAGADVIKLFPGRVATPGYFRDVLGPFPGVRLMPTGNVDLETAPEYIRAGAIGVGVGKALVDPGALREGRWSDITGNALRFRAVVDEAREGR
jgi:2-dehydro-3-deoxyphosphogluconate aldolase/(4S)-4-hydroxy-2-oxoglutarate aldolase